jgi:hypothetical protein
MVRKYEQFRPTGKPIRHAIAQCQMSPPDLILVVDDDIAIQRLIPATMVGSGYDEQYDRNVL